MVIISVGVCNKNGQLLLSRQFDSLSRTAVQDLYLSFPKLIHQNQQHTYVQSAKHTYLYIPIESLYLVLISSHNSNIIEDQETIRMLYKVICSVCGQGIQADTIEKNAVDIILGIDDLISMGFRESVSLQEVETELKLESAEQKAHLALLKQQEQDAKMAAEKQRNK